jgi:hypothetical protein
MNQRQRYLETLLFGRPDRIPFCPGEPRESTLAAWRQQGLPEGADWRSVLLETLGVDRQAMPSCQSLGADFRMIPLFEEKVLERKDGHLIVQDWKGNVCEISDCYDVTYLREPKDFVTRRWLKCPVENRDDWERMKERYDMNSPGRLPADSEQRWRRLQNGDSVVAVSVSGPFWQMREWCGFEGLCILMVEQPDWVVEMAAFWTEFVSGVLDRILRHIVPDVVEISEDMAYKFKATISPGMTREFCKPSWDRWTGQLRAAGCPLIDMDSDGYIGELIPIWIESGINVCDPIEVAAGNDINEFRRRFGRTMAYRCGVDKRAMARGGREMLDEMKRLEAVVEDGGYIPGCDHGVPADVSWPDFVKYCRVLAKMTGW